MKDFLAHLHDFGGQLFASMEENHFLNDGFDRNTISLKKMYIMYLMTGGKTDVTHLNPLQKTQLFLFTQVSLLHTGAEGVGVLAAKGIESIIQGTPEAQEGFMSFLHKNPDIKNILETLGRFVKRVLKAVYDSVVGVAKGVFKQNPLL